ncbi:hypothetical protein HDU97_002694 [Phlyctochytrium planicorne]|nr:hypothetical protein HDU97_002694 [Phlyctochytrium planicorne]
MWSRRKKSEADNRPSLEGISLQNHHHQKAHAYGVASIFRSLFRTTASTPAPTPSTDKEKPGGIATTPKIKPSSIRDQPDVIISSNDLFVPAAARTKSLQPAMAIHQNQQQQIPKDEGPVFVPVAVSALFCDLCGLAKSAEDHHACPVITNEKLALAVPIPRSSVSKPRASEEPMMASSPAETMHDSPKSSISLDKRFETQMVSLQSVLSKIKQNQMAKTENLLKAHFVEREVENGRKSFSEGDRVQEFSPMTYKPLYLQNLSQRSMSTSSVAQPVPRRSDSNSSFMNVFPRHSVLLDSVKQSDNQKKRLSGRFGGVKLGSRSNSQSSPLTQLSHSPVMPAQVTSTTSTPSPQPFSPEFHASVSRLPNITYAQPRPTVPTRDTSLLSTRPTNTVHKDLHSEVQAALSRPASAASMADSGYGRSLASKPSVGTFRSSTQSVPVGQLLGNHHTNHHEHLSRSSNFFVGSTTVSLRSVPSVEDVGATLRSVSSREDVGKIGGVAKETFQEPTFLAESGSLEDFIGRLKQMW